VYTVGCSTNRFAVVALKRLCAMPTAEAPSRLSTPMVALAPRGSARAGVAAQ
jgi:hypothetical protein